MMERFLRAGLCLPILLLLPVASLHADVIKVVGTIKSGSWMTEVELANPYPFPLTVRLHYGLPFALCPSPVCGFVSVALAPNGTAKRSLNYLPNRFATLWIDAPSDPVRLPTVKVRIFDSVMPFRFVELPAVRQSTIAAQNASSLTFPSANRGPDSYSSLVLAGTGPLLIEAFSSSGVLLGSETLSAGAGLTENLFVRDVLDDLGIAELQDGQIRVTRLAESTDPFFWGFLAKVTNTTISTSLGRNP